MKLLGVRWFSGRSTIGVVQYIEDEEVPVYRQTGNADYKYYIGVGDGRDEKEDMQIISNWGSTFDKAAGDVLFKVYKGEPI